MWEEPPVLSNDPIPKGVAMGWMGRERLEDMQAINNKQFNLPAEGDWMGERESRGTGVITQSVPYPQLYAAASAPLY